MLYGAIAGIEKEISVLGLGTAQFGSQLSQAASFSLLDRFAAAGGTLVDTAHVYGAWDREGVNGGCGNSEVVIGRWLRARGNRDEMVIGTKGGHPDFETKAPGLTRETVLRHLEESLERLQTDYVDLYWLHRDDRSIPVAEILGWLATPCRDGIIRALGCSHWRSDRLARAQAAAAALALPPVRASQIAWSLAAPAATCTNGPYGEQLAMDDTTWQYHAASGLPVVAYNAQAGGFFAAKYDDRDFAAADFPKPGLAARYGSPANIRRRTIARQLALEKKCSTNQVALAWLLHQPFPAFALIGPRNREQLEDSLGAATVNLTRSEWRQLAGISTKE